jgi:hypothetical protein
MAFGILLSRIHSIFNQQNLLLIVNALSTHHHVLHSSRSSPGTSFYSASTISSLTPGTANDLGWRCRSLLPEESGGSVSVRTQERYIMNGVD